MSRDHTTALPAWVAEQDYILKNKRETEKEEIKKERRKEKEKEREREREEGKERQEGKEGKEIPQRDKGCRI